MIIAVFSAYERISEFVLFFGLYAEYMFYNTAPYGTLAEIGFLYDISFPILTRWFFV